MMVVILTPVDGIIRWLPRGFSCSPIMVANINLIKQESYSVVNLEKQLSRTVTNKIITMSK